MKKAKFCFTRVDYNQNDRIDILQFSQNSDGKSDRTKLLVNPAYPFKIFLSCNNFHLNGDSFPEISFKIVVRYEILKFPFPVAFL